MSPLGTLVVGSSSSSSEKSPYGFNEPLLRLMSLSLVNNPGASAAAFFSNLHCQAAAAAAAHSLAMQFKNSSEEPPKSSPTSTEDQTNDEDEVLSIGREDEEQMVIDCDSDEVESDRTTECLDEDRVISPDGEESQDFKKGPSRESLMFSIANILRPDFGQPQQQQQQQISPSKSLQRSMQHQLNHHLFKLNQQSESLRKSSSASSHHRLQTKHRRSDLSDPIDLSRPQGDVKVGKFHDHKSSSSSPPSEIRARKDPAKNTDEGKSSGDDKDNKNLWPAWVYCTRYSDRPSSGPRTRRTRKKEKEVDEKRPRTAFTADQLQRLKKEFDENRYLTEKRRQDLARDLRLHENQIKIWFQNKRAKLKKSTGQRGGLALQLMAQGLYNHSTIPPKTDQEGSDDSD